MPKKKKVLDALMKKQLMIAGAAIRCARDNRGMTQDDLSEATGCDTRTIIKLEKGEVDSQFSTFCSIIQVLEMDARILFNEKRNNIVPTIAQLQEMLNGCNEDEAQVLMNLCQIALSAMRNSGSYELIRKK